MNFNGFDCLWCHVKLEVSKEAHILGILMAREYHSWTQTMNLTKFLNFQKKKWE